MLACAHLSQETPTAEIERYTTCFNGVDASSSAETPSHLLAERLAYYGVFLGAAAYGLNVAIFAITIRLLRRWEKRYWVDSLWLPYVVVLFVATTAGNAVHLQFTQEVFIDHRTYPGGPSVYYVVGSTSYMSPVHLVVYAITLILQDGLLLYRCWIIYGKRNSAFVLPVFLFLVGLGSAIAGLTMLFHLRESFWSHGRMILALGLSSLSCTILLTLAIVTRLLILRYNVHGILGSSSVPYVSLSGIFVESAFIYTAGTMSFLIAYYLKSPVQNLVLPIALQAQPLS